MTYQEWLREHCPNLHRLLAEMALDNDMRWREDDEAGVGLGEANYASLEGEASRLEGDEFVLMAAGEETEILALVAAKDLSDLDQFLNECFDGEFRDMIWGDYRPSWSPAGGRM